MTFKIQRSRKRKQPFYFTIVAKNGQILTSSETYHNLDDCENAINIIRNEAAEAELVINNQKEISKAKSIMKKIIPLILIALLFGCKPVTVPDADTVDTIAMMADTIVTDTSIHTNARMSSAAAVPVPVASISITTTNATPITFQIGTNLVDMCFVRSPSMGVEKDLLETSFLSQIKALGFQRGVYPSDGSIANYNYVALPPLKGSGYNMRESDFATNDEFRDWGNGVGITAWISDFFTKTVEFTKAWGVPCDIVINKNDTWDEVKYRIDGSQAEYILFNAETVTTDWTYTKFLEWAKPMRDSILKYYTGKKLINNCARTYRGSRKSLLWNSNINPTTLTGMYGGDAYYQINDIESFNRNQDSNFIKVQHFFDVAVPENNTSFTSLFPGWKIIGGELVIEDHRDKVELYVDGKIAGIYARGRFYEMLLKNQDIIPVAYQMSLKNLSDPTDPNYQVTRILNRLPKQRNITSMTITGMDGVTGVSVSDGANQTVLFNNATSKQYSFSSFQVNSKNKTPTFTNHTFHAVSADADIIQDSIVSTSFTIYPYSVNVVSFLK